jgi:hypothetical protein
VKYYYGIVAHYIYAIQRPDLARPYADSQWALLQSGILTSSNQIARVYHTQGMYAMGRELYDSAITFNLQALSILRPPVDSVLFYSIHESISELYQIQKNYDRAIYYYTPQLEKAKLMQDSIRDLYILINGFCYAFPSDKDSLKEIGRS